MGTDQHHIIDALLALARMIQAEKTCQKVKCAVFFPTYGVCSACDGRFYCQALVDFNAHVMALANLAGG